MTPVTPVTDVTHGVMYLDSSAIVKLVFEEEETAALRTFLARFTHRASSVLSRIEVFRTAARVGDPLVTRDAVETLDRIHLIWPDVRLLGHAMTMAPPVLRALDAIHLATALSLQPDLAGMVVYDRALAEAAQAVGLTVFAPS